MFVDIQYICLLNYSWTQKAMKNKLTNIPQRKTTLKWNINWDLSYVDMAGIIDALSVVKLREYELACKRVSRDKQALNLSMWW